jgi:HD-like signal output (HDOD) protein
MSTRLLFVDDEPFLRDGIRRLLTRRRPEWELAFADCGTSALQVMESASFDIVVSDMRMPGMDGAGLLERVRDLDPGVVRIILSGQSDRSAALRAAKVAHQFLAKPFDVALLEATLDRLCGLRQLMSDAKLQHLAGGIESLPSTPKVYTQLVELLAREEASIVEVSEILKQDSAMSAKVLQMVRSAFFGAHVDTVSIDEAVARLGIDVIKSMALTAGVFEAFKQNGDIPGFSAAAEQQHSLSVARASATILRDKAEAGDAFMAGMLHDVGKLVLAAKSPDVLRTVVERASTEGRPMSAVEREELSTTHAEIGGYLLGIWGLPRAVVEAVAHHHAPDGLTCPAMDAATAVHIADVLVRELDPRYEDGCFVSVNHEYLDSVGVADRLVEWRESIQDLFDAGN